MTTYTTTTTTSNSGFVTFTVSDLVLDKSVYLSGYDLKKVRDPLPLDPNRPRSVMEDEDSE